MKAALIRLFRKLSLAMSFGVLVAAFLLVILWNSIVHTVPVGHSAVLWHRLPIFGIAASRGPPFRRGAPDTTLGQVVHL